MATVAARPGAGWVFLGRHHADHCLLRAEQGKREREREGWNMLDLKKRMMRDESESTISAMAKKRSSKAPNPSKKSTPISIYLKSVLRHSVTEQLSDVPLHLAHCWIWRRIAPTMADDQMRSISRCWNHCSWDHQLIPPRTTIPRAARCHPGSRATARRIRGRVSVWRSRKEGQKQQLPSNVDLFDQLHHMSDGNEEVFNPNGRVSSSRVYYITYYT